MYRHWKLLGGEEDVVDQLVLPVQCRRTVLEMVHNIPMVGHLGKKKTLGRIQRRFYWPSMFHDVSEYCKSAGKKLATKAKLNTPPHY